MAFGNLVGINRVGEIKVIREGCVMKKKYHSLNFCITYLLREDILTASGDFVGGGTDVDGDWHEDWVPNTGNG